MATVPLPRLWSAGEIPTAAHFNLDIRDAVNFYKSPPAAIVKHGSNVTITHATWSVLSWTEADPVDNDGIHSTSVNTSRLVAATAGWYYFFAHVRWENHVDNSGARIIHVRRGAGGNIANGVRCGGDARHSNNVGNDRHGQSCTGYQNLAVNEYLELFVWHDQRNPAVLPPFYEDVDSRVYHADTTTPVRFGMIWMGA